MQAFVPGFGNLRMTDPKGTCSSSHAWLARVRKPILRPQAASSPELGVWPLKQVGREGEKNKQTKPSIAVYTEVRLQVMW